MYMGKIGHYQGPEIHSILWNLYKLKPQIKSNDRILYFSTFTAFKNVFHSIFGEILTVDMRHRLYVLGY